MDPYIAISLVEYINLLQKGRLDRSHFNYYERAVKNCTAREVNLAIENLIIRYRDVEAVEIAVARFIHAVTAGLEKSPIPEYTADGIFSILRGENKVIDGLLKNLKKTYLEFLPGLRENDLQSRSRFLKEIARIETIKRHYHKLQYGVFSALESEGAPTICIQLMWHLEDSIWPKLKQCRDYLSGDDWDFNQFNKVYGPMFFLLGSLMFREEKILYPIACEYLSEPVQRRLMKDAETYGIMR